MPKITVRYSFEWSQDPKDSTSFCHYVSDQNLFLAIAKLGLNLNKPFKASDPYIMYSIEADETDPIHSKVWELFRDHGINLDKVPGFRPSRLRHYEKTELDQFEYLWLRPAGIPSIALFAENLEGVHVLYANSRLKSKLAFAPEEVTRVFYASEIGKGYLDSQGLIGISWEPAVFDRPEKALKKLFRLRSLVTMPKCLTRIVDGGYRDVTELPINECANRQWYDGGYLPAELRFVRGEVEALGQFDVALTQEEVGGFPRWFHPEVIVSQRFRQVLLKMKNTSVGFNPVHLV